MSVAELAQFSSLISKPSSYFLQTTNVGILLNACASLISSDLTNVWSTSTLAAGPLPTKHPLSTVSKADIASNTVWADVIQVRWHSTNSKIMQLLASESTAPSSSRSSGSGSSASASGSVSPSITSSAALPTLPSSGNSNQDNSGGGLSSGAKAGIGIGVALGVVILAAVAAFLFFRRRRRGNKAVQHDAQGGINPTGYHEMEHKSTGGLPASEMGHKHPAAPPPAEMDGGNIGELSGAEARAELDHRQ